MSHDKFLFQNGGGVNDGVLNSYCWMYSSFMIPPDFEGPCARQEHDGSVLYNSYYQARVGDFQGWGKVPYLRNEVPFQWNFTHEQTWDL